MCQTILASVRQMSWRPDVLSRNVKTASPKSVELEIVYARVHLLNEGRLYKIDQTKKKLLTSCSFITSRADTDAVY